MAVKEIPAGTVIIQSEQPISAIKVITKGCVLASYPGGEIYLHKGDVIGVCELSYDSHFITYRSVEDTSIATYPCSDKMLTQIIRTKPDLCNLITNSLFRQTLQILDQFEMSKFDCDTFYQYLMNSYQEYSRVTTKHSLPTRVLPELDSVTELVLEEDIPGWAYQYYEQLQRVCKSISSKAQIADFICGTIFKASFDIHRVLSFCRVIYDYKSEIVSFLMNENRLDFFDLYASVLYKIGAHDEDSTAITAAIGTMMIQLESQDSIDKDMYKARVAEYKSRLADLENATEAPTADKSSANIKDELIGSLDIILSYSECDEEVASSFRADIDKFNKLSDKNATDDTCRKLRNSITKNFYKVYSSAFIKSLEDPKVPKIVKMFFNFGYVDERLAGIDNAAYLYSVVDSIPSDPSRGVYTVYEWLTAVYEGRKVPSRNEFDNDFPAYVRDLKVRGEITAEDEARMLSDQKEQALFELNNMVQSGNKMTFGRVSIFSPIFLESNVLKDLENTLVNADMVEKSFENIRAIDFSAYYRETMYSNPDIGIGKESIDVEILPDIILMPNVGVRGVTWQEIEGRKRTSPARMMISIFEMEDLNNILVRLTGEYRWEMCKRIHGARWNDVSEPSLTSEYFDYIQFYKKNRELSADAKDKVKLSMQKAKNRIKEMFVRDYEAWVLYEGVGSPRLNKVARTILFTHCPFAKDVRDKLKINPLYKEMMDKYDIKLMQKVKHLDNLCQKLKNTGVEIPAEIEEQRAYIGM